MKVFIIILLLFITRFSFSQIGVVTLEDGTEYVPMNMWYTIHEEDRLNQMYYTSHDKKVTKSLLEKILFDYGHKLSKPSGVDEEGSNFWEIELGNGFISWVFYTEEEEDFYTITILTDDVE